MIDIPKLTPQEIAELDVYACQEELANITSLLANLNGEMFTASQELGKARVKMEQLKNAKSTLIEIARCLKAVIGK